MTINLSALQKQRRDSAANWTAENPTLLAGEIGIESDTGYWKVGDGSTAWTSLAYVSGLGAEIPVDRLADGTAGQIIQTDSAGTGVEWSITANLPLGSASAPAYRFQGDPNTGIYSPGADQVAISTNGQERLRITSDGKLGLGTIAPGTNLEIKKDTASTFYDTTIDTTILLSGTPGAENGNFGGSIGFSRLDSVSRINAAIAIKQTTADSDQCGLSFFTHSSASTGAALSESLSITHDGKVGIGTTSPGSTLHLGGAPTLSLRDGKNWIRTDSGDPVEFGSFNGFTFNKCTVADYVVDTEWARIDSSGRLLVGTSTARASTNFKDGGYSTPLQIEGAADNISYGPTFVANTGTTNPTFRGAIATLARTRGTSLGSNTSVSNGDLLGRLQFSGADGTNLVPAAWVTAYVDGTPGANDMPGRLVFSTTADGASSPTERMRLNNTGVIYHYANAGVMSLRSAAASGTTNVFITALHSASSTTSGGTVSFEVKTNGDVINTNNSYGAISDVKLKENIVDANSQWDDLKALQVRNYNLKEGQTHTQIGLIAQEVELVSPGLVSESPDRDEDGNDLGTVTKSVNYSVLYMKAVKALQEAMERIETLEAKVAALEAS